MVAARPAAERNVATRPAEMRAIMHASFRLMMIAWNHSCANEVRKPFTKPFTSFACLSAGFFPHQYHTIMRGYRHDDVVRGRRRANGTGT
jgi:hypothetical protein